MIPINLTEDQTKDLVWLLLILEKKLIIDTIVIKNTGDDLLRDTIRKLEITTDLKNTIKQQLNEIQQ